MTPSAIGFSASPSPVRTWAQYFQEVAHSPCFRESDRQGYYLFPDDPAALFYPSFPCARFYWTGHPDDIDTTCRDCLRRQMQLEMDRANQRCIFAPCATAEDTSVCETGPCPNLLLDVSPPPTAQQWSDWAACVQQNSDLCSDNLIGATDPAVLLEAKIVAQSL